MTTSYLKKSLQTMGRAVTGTGAALIFCVAGAQAQETEIGKNVLIELNAIKDVEAGCSLTFLVLNGHDKPINKAVYETVLFDQNGQVDRLTLFDFGTLPPARPRVRQFAVTGIACANLSQVLINGAHACDAPELGATACEADLQVNSRTDVEVSG